MAYDAKHNVIYAGYGSVSNQGNIYKIKLDNTKHVSSSSKIFNTCSFSCPTEIDDGLAYDASNGTLYYSPDTSATIWHLATTGTVLGSFSWIGSSCFNSGLAIGGQLLFEGADGCTTVYVVKKSSPNTLDFSFSTPGTRDEGMTCDNVTFSQNAMWSEDAYSSTAYAFAIPPGSCGAGGQAARRYLALGDSVPYGHGLANPDKKKHDGVATNQGPSQYAWPSLVDQGVPGLSPLRMRPTSCSLVGPHKTHYDQLAISGAPTERNKWTGKDNSCTYPKGVTVPVHKAVEPNEIDASTLKPNPPVLVTIQAGADDIDFAGCLGALLGEPSQLGADKCVTHDKSGYHLTSKANDELKSVKRGLGRAVSDIRTYAPHTRILLVGYYQIVPGASAPVQGTSVICRDIRLRSHTKGWRKSFRAAADYVQQRLNDAIQSVAQPKKGINFVNIADLFSGHEICTKGSWLFDGLWRAAHPTKKGQSAIARAVIDKCHNLPGHCLGR